MAGFSLWHMPQMPYTFMPPEYQAMQANNLQNLARLQADGDRMLAEGAAQQRQRDARNKADPASRRRTSQTKFGRFTTYVDPRTPDGPDTADRYQFNPYTGAREFLG